MLDIFWTLFIMVEFFVTIITFYYLRQEYVKELENYYKKNLEFKNYSITKKNENKKSIIQMNITQNIDTQEINKQIGYVQLEFIKNGEHFMSDKISKRKIHIGRDSRNDIIVKDHTVSKQQCLIIRKDNKFILRNFSTINSTRLNGKTVKNKEEVKYGDVVNIGKVAFKLNNISEVV